MPRTRLRHFFLHSIIVHIFLGVVITLGIIYLFDKETSSGGAGGQRLEPVLVTVIDESGDQKQDSEEPATEPQISEQEEQENSEQKEERVEQETEPEPVDEIAIKQVVEPKSVTRPQEPKEPQKKTAETQKEKSSVADRESVNQSEDNSVAKLDNGENSEQAVGSSSEIEAIEKSPGEVAFNNVQGARPNYGLNPKPPYPRSARRRGYEGTVLLSVQVLENGKVGDISIKSPSGHSVLDESALKAVKDWVFIPGKKGGKEVSSWVEVPIKYRLDSG